MADLRTQQFAQALSSVPIGAPVAVECRRLVDRLSGNLWLRGGAVTLLSVLILLLVRPPFVMAFEYDRSRPWKARAHVSWLSVLLVALLVGGAAVVVPWFC